MKRTFLESHSELPQEEHYYSSLKQAEQDLERLSQEIGMLNESLREKLMEVKAVASGATESCRASDDIRARVTGLERISGIILMKRPQGDWIVMNLPIDLFQDERLQAQSEKIQSQQSFSTLVPSDEVNINNIPVFQPIISGVDSYLGQWQDYGS